MRNTLNIDPALKLNYFWSPRVSFDASLGVQKLLEMDEVLPFSATGIPVSRERRESGTVKTRTPAGGHGRGAAR